MLIGTEGRGRRSIDKRIENRFTIRMTIIMTIRGEDNHCHNVFRILVSIHGGGRCDVMYLSGLATAGRVRDTMVPTHHRGRVQ